MPNVSRYRYLQLHLIVLIWGFTGLLGALIHLEAIPMVWLRMVLACIFLGGAIVVKGLHLRISAPQARKLLFSGCVIAVHWFAFFHAIKVSNVSITLACLSSGAFFVSLIQPLWQGKRINWAELGVSMIGVLGFCLIFSVEFQYWEGILWAFLAALLSALFAVLNHQLVQELQPIPIAFYELLSGICLFSILLWNTQPYVEVFVNMSPSDWLYMLVLSSVCTAYAFAGSVSVMRSLSPYTVMLTINLEPIYGIGLAIAFLHEHQQLDPRFYAGLLLILATILWSAVQQHRTQSLSAS